MTGYLAALALFLLGLYWTQAAGVDGWLTHAAGVALMAVAVLVAIVTAIIQ